MAPGTVIIGSPNEFTAFDNGNANLLPVQNGPSTQLNARLTLQYLVFLVNNPAGTLNLGVYTEPGANTSQPGALLAQTGTFTPVQGWNVVPVQVPVQLQPGNYGLGYNPSDNNLSFWKTNSTGQCSYENFAAGGSMDNPYSGPTGNCTPTTWSFYAIFTPAPPPPVAGVCGSANGSPSSVPPSSGLCSKGNATPVSGGNGSAWTWGCNGTNGGGNASCSAPFVPPTINGTCGSAAGIFSATPPSSGLCSKGNATPVSGGNGSPWAWSCTGSNGGPTATCTAPSQKGQTTGGQKPGPSERSVQFSPYYRCVTNYYVATTGSDSNDGKAAPWLTLQHADSMNVGAGCVHQRRARHL